MSKNEPTLAKDSVMVRGDASKLPTAEAIVVKGFDWEDKKNTVTDSNGKKHVDYSKILDAYYTSGFQSTNFGLCMGQMEEMIKARIELEPKSAEPGATPVYQSTEYDPSEDFNCGDFTRPKPPCTIFFSFTSNLISSGVRDTIRYLAKHNMVDVIITTAGGIEEDMIKCLAKTYLGDFKLDGKKLRKDGMNRIGNLIVPNDNYCLFEDWITPHMETMADMQEKGKKWTPSSMIHFLGEKLGELPNKAGEQSVWYWAWKNKIPVFSPALTDGSLGDMLYFFNYKRELHVEIVQDLKLLNDIAMKSSKSGMIICGGGLVKHHTCNANLMRNGADYAVYINTAAEYDGSDAGASPDEAISWGKIRITAKPAKLVAEVTLVLPLLVGKTFYEYEDKIAEFDEKLKALRAKLAAEKKD